jgi:putative transposase
MPRKPRFGLTEVPQHVIQRGNNHNACFFAEEDYRFYLDCVKQAAERYRCTVHAYVLMTNHVHMLITPLAHDSIPRLMQHIGRRYVQYVNYMYRRSGTLWEGRYKASLVDADNYLLTCYRYIELNPVRANMVQAPDDYRWSSYRHNAQGAPDSLLIPHAGYLALGGNPVERQNAYRELFRHHLDDAALREIRVALNQEVAIGSDRFKEEIEKSLSRRTQPASRGRPRKASIHSSELAQE